MNLKKKDRTSCDLCFKCYPYYLSKSCESNDESKEENTYCFLSGVEAVIEKDHLCKFISPEKVRAIKAKKYKKKEFYKKNGLGMSAIIVILCTLLFIISVICFLNETSLYFNQIKNYIFNAVEIIKELFWRKVK